MENLDIYNALRQVPQEAKKTIAGGPLKGFTDINPMWRIKKLTETFGPCGLGWITKDVRHWTETTSRGAAAFCELNLYVKYPGQTEWSGPIYGIGGSTLTGGRAGDTISDEAAKMAYTDAISVACKALGMAADVYFEKDRTKYDLAAAPAPATAPATSSYKPLSQEAYWNTIAAHATGRTTDSGESIRTWWINKTHAGEAEIAKFDKDVNNYITANT